MWLREYENFCFSHQITRLLHLRMLPYIKDKIPINLFPFLIFSWISSDLTKNVRSTIGEPCNIYQSPVGGGQMGISSKTCWNWSRCIFNSSCLSRNINEKNCSICISSKFLSEKLEDYINNLLGCNCRCWEWMKDNFSRLWESILYSTWVSMGMISYWVYLGDI